LRSFSLLLAGELDSLSAICLFISWRGRHLMVQPFPPGDQAGRVVTATATALAAQPKSPTCCGSLPVEGIIVGSLFLRGGFSGAVAACLVAMILLPVSPVHQHSCAVYRCILVLNVGVWCWSPPYCAT
jgi:hypothetical protein